jgi:hypothetical protein
MTMTLNELEVEVMHLKEQLAECARVKDYIEIWQLMSTYSHLYHVMRRSDIPSLFAQKTPGVTVEIEDSGIYEGLDGVNKIFCGILSERKHMAPGFLGVHMTVNPILEFNKEGTRAKGLFHSPGLCTKMVKGQQTAYWWWGKYDIEYVKEDGEWKFLKLACWIIFQCPYDKGWVEAPMAGSSRCFPGYEPDKPSTNYMPYNPWRINDFKPGPPEPYKD